MCRGLPRPQSPSRRRWGQGGDPLVSSRKGGQGTRWTQQPRKTVQPESLPHGCRAERWEPPGLGPCLALPPAVGLPRAHPGRGLPCPVSVTPQCSLPKGLGSTAGRTFRLEPRTRATSWRQRRGPRDACVPGGPREHGAGCLCAVGTSSRAALGLTRQLGEG